MRNKLKRLLSESFLYGFAGILEKMIGFFLLPLYMVVFTPADYGVIALIDITVELAGACAYSGMIYAATRWYYDEDHDEGKQSVVATWFWSAILLGAATFSILMVVCWNADTLFGPNTRLPFFIAACGVLAVVAQEVLIRWLRLEERPKASVIAGIGSSLLTIGLIFTFVIICDFGLVGLFSGRLLGRSIVSLIAVYVMRRQLSFSKFSVEKLKPMMRFAVPLMPSTIGLWVMAVSDRYIVKLYWGNDETGLYSTAAKLAIAVGVFSTAFATAWGPFSMSVMHDDDADDVYVATLSHYVFWGSLVCVLFSLTFPTLLRWFAPPAYLGAISCMAMLAFANIGMGASYIAQLGATLAKQAKPMSVAIAIGAASNIVLNFLFIPSMGRDGAALATLLAVAIYVGYQFYASQSYHPIPFRWKQAALPIIVGVAIMVLGHNQRPLVASMLCILTCFVYFAVGRYLALLPSLRSSYAICTSWLSPRVEQ